MRNKKLAVLIGVVCLALLAAAVVFSLKGRGSNQAETSVDADSVVSSGDTEQPSSSPSQEEGADSSGSGGGQQTPSQESNGESANGDTADASISFPYAIPNTNLTIQKIAGYDGIYLEDGSDTEVSGVAAMVLENSGTVPVEYAAVTIFCGGQQLVFQASDIPAGACVVVQEANQASYQSGTYTDCTAETAEMTAFELSADQVKVEENEDGSLTVYNLTEEDIPCVRIFYKFYYEEENAYIGGITYTAKLTNLAAKASQTVTPSHYSAGYSKIMMIRTYDDAD